MQRPAAGRSGGSLSWYVAMIRATQMVHHSSKQCRVPLGLEFHFDFVLTKISVPNWMCLSWMKSERHLKLIWTRQRTKSVFSFGMCSCGCLVADCRESLGFVCESLWSLSRAHCGHCSNFEPKQFAQKENEEKCVSIHHFNMSISLNWAILNCEAFCFQKQAAFRDGL